MQGEVTFYRQATFGTYRLPVAQKKAAWVEIHSMFKIENAGMIRLSPSDKTAPLYTNLPF